jgi:hypothetical protein
MAVIRNRWHFRTMPLGNRLINRGVIKFSPTPVKAELLRSLMPETEDFVFRVNAHQRSIGRGPTYRSRLLCACVAWFIAGLVFFIGFASKVQAQISTAAVVGTMTDSSGAAVVGVKVTATNIDTGLVYASETNGSGEFVIPALPPGRYKVQGVLAGFKTWQIPEVTLAVGDRFRADSRMEIGQIQQSVEVRADTAALCRPNQRRWVL